MHPYERPLFDEKELRKIGRRKKTKLSRWFDSLVVSVAIVSFLGAVIFMILFFTGFWDETVSQDGEFVEIIKGDHKAYADKDTLVYIDQDGYVQDDDDFVIVINKEIEEPNVTFDRVYIFDEFRYTENLELELPSKEWLNRITK